MNCRVILAIFILILLIGCKDIHNWESCEGYKTIQGVNYYHNNIDGAIECSALTSKPILLQFADWSVSDHTFYQRIITNSSVNHLLKTDFILLDLMCDDQERTSLDSYSLRLKDLGLSNVSTIGEANQNLKNKFISGNGKANPQYLIINKEFEKLADEWSYVSKPKELYRKLKAAKN